MEAQREAPSEAFVHSSLEGLQISAGRDRRE